MKLEEILANKNSWIHFIGIGGVSMSSLAMLLNNHGHKITGSDIRMSLNIQKLKDKNIDVKLYQKKENIKNCDLVVYTAAVSNDNEELKEARDRGILTVERCTLLGELMKKYKYPINVSGTHGKTTTTAMLAEIFSDGKMEPTVSIGGDFDKIGGNLLIGKNDYFIVEACEYVESFLKFFPYASLILNIEEDHLDYYRGIEHIKSAFQKFANKTDENGFVVINGDDKNCMDIISDIKPKTYTFGLDKDNYCYGENIVISDGKPSFDVIIDKKYVGNVTLNVLGEHNVLNALSAILTAVLFGIPFESIKKSLFNFKGAKRRFQYIGKHNNALIYDDYAHHPTEIRTAIKSAKATAHKNLYVVFQPHTYTRTKSLFNDFVEVLKEGENVIITDIYAAREKNNYDISSKDLVNEIPNAKYVGSLIDAAIYLSEVLEDGDLIITIGAGDVYKIGKVLNNNK